VVATGETVGPGVRDDLGRKRGGGGWAESGLRAIPCRLRAAALFPAMACFGKLLSLHLGGRRRLGQ
jgi:hypothetical protein